jgi:hypothetical protein
MPEYKIEIPNEKLIKCLDIINRKADGSITKRESKDAAIEAVFIHVDEKRITTIARTKQEYSDQAAYMPLNKNLIAPLLNGDSSPRVRLRLIILSLTEDGKHALKFLGTDI